MIAELNTVSSEISTTDEPVRQFFFYERSKLTTTYKMLIVMAANMWSLSELLNIMAANISGFTVII